LADPKGEAGETIANVVQPTGGKTRTAVGQEGANGERAPGPSKE